MKFNISEFDPSRRDFLKSLGIGAISALIPWDFNMLSYGRNPKLGRVTFDGIPLYGEPDISATRIKRLQLNQVHFITKTLIKGDRSSHNRKWYQLNEGGYAHSAYIQPVQYNPQREIGEIPESGRVGEITIPLVRSYTKPGGKTESYSLCYSSMFWVTGVEKDNDGKNWYRIMDDRFYNTFFIPTEAMRIIPYNELEPVSTDVPPEDKHILVDIQAQTMTAYEGEKQVRTCQISTGIHDSTPRGWFTITRKRPCRHMEGEGFDLPGVPWVSYIAGSGIGFHGVYWHNDLGIPHSHGCIHLPIKVAHWLYLWTIPSVPKDKYIFSDPNGTRVQII